MNATEKRFKVAFSFPGEYREQVERIVKGVAEVIPEEKIFYDRNFEEEVARCNADLYLQNIYKSAELIVVFLCKEYNEKPWCEVEKRIIRSLIYTKKADVLPVKIGDGEVDGFLEGVDIYLDYARLGEQEIVNTILKRCKVKPKGPTVTSQKKTCKVNQEYAQSFRAPLFLHREEENTKVTLEHLFVMQKYKDLEYDEEEQKFVAVGGESAEEKDDLQDFLVKFLNDNKKRCVFISGGAGVGKTSLVAWMNHHYECEDEIGKKLFGKHFRPLITVRLCDLSKEQLAQEDGLLKAICEDLGLKDASGLLEQYPKAVVVLDGFDELCMIEERDGVKASAAMKNLFAKALTGFQFIVTTRPNYLDKKLNETTIKKSIAISLEHFDDKKRGEWLEKYLSKDGCHQTIDPAIEEYIRNVEEEEISCICDTPMILYMLAAKDGTEDYINNGWMVALPIYLFGSIK